MVCHELTTRLVLSERPMYGYEIIKELGKRFAGYWEPKTGTIYPALEKLEQDKLVTSQRERKALIENIMLLPKKEKLSFYNLCCAGLR